MINITFPNGSIKQFKQFSTALEIAKTISNSLSKKVLVSKVNGELYDAMRPIPIDATLELLTFDDIDGQKTFWHSSAHVLAEALEQLFSGIKLGIGPSIETGFYYDIDFGEHKISDNDLDKIEQKMLQLAAQNNSFIRKEISKSDAIQHFTLKQDPYKLELLENLEDGNITFYQQGQFTDLCKGTHLPNTSYIKNIKLTTIAGAYWRGNEKNKQLTRIYGVSYPNAQLLQEYILRLEEAKKRDHRKLGLELGLFAFSDKVGAGLPLWLPKGTAVRQRLEDFLKNEQIKMGYLPVITPHIGKKELYITSGHYEKYGKDSFQPILTPDESEEFLLKPMNCPHHCEIYKTQPRSYRDLPLRLAEFGTVYRYEQSGELHGLTRVRGFTQDDAHIFCTAEQLESEFGKVIQLTQKVLSKLNFTEFTAQISLRDKENADKYIGSEENWIKSEQAIINSVQLYNLKTTTNLGEAAFYGPKLDFMVKDAIGRQWQLGTIQVDYNLPQRFGLEYTGNDNEKHCPIMIHRAPFGSIERFLGVLLEHCAGDLPLWLIPEQVIVLPISEKFNEYSQNIVNQLVSTNIRSLIDDRNEKIGRKIRDSELLKIPFMLIIGEQEIEKQQLSVRQRKIGIIGTFTFDDFVTFIHQQINQ